MSGPALLDQLTGPGETGVIENVSGEVDEAIFVGDGENSSGLQVRHA